ncbi:MAG: DNA topoisomerase, partial [Bacteroidia bacterium]|nr:DNA topoisomerase [Bacteroidia bacterium]
TEASLVKRLEELGIGRPSTYAPTISTIQKREYVVKEDREGKTRNFRQIQLKNQQITIQNLQEITGTEKGKLFPTDIGILVTDFLVEYFPDIIDYSFTAKVENDFDEIAKGEIEWNDMIKTFYYPFHSQVEKTVEIAERVAGERYLGTDPESGLPVLVRLGRYGPLVQIGNAENGVEKPRFASLRPGQRIESITLEEALDLFKLPREIGLWEGKKVKAAIGKFGPYIQIGDKFVSLPKGKDPLHISMEEAIALYEAKLATDASKIIKEFGETPFKIVKGRWGPYLTYEKLSIKLPKDKKPEDITLEDCQQLLNDYLEKNPPKAKKTAAKQSTTTSTAVKRSNSPNKKSSEQKTKTRKKT